MSCCTSRITRSIVLARTDIGLLVTSVDCCSGWCIVTASELFCIIFGFRYLFPRTFCSCLCTWLSSKTSLSVFNNRTSHGLAVVSPVVSTSLELPSANSSKRPPNRQSQPSTFDVWTHHTYYYVGVVLYKQTFFSPLVSHFSSILSIILIPLPTDTVRRWTRLVYQQRHEKVAQVQQHTLVVVLIGKFMWVMMSEFSTNSSRPVTMLRLPRFAEMRMVVVMRSQ